MKSSILLVFTAISIVFARPAQEMRLEMDRRALQGLTPMNRDVLQDKLKEFEKIVEEQEYTITRVADEAEEKIENAEEKVREATIALSQSQQEPLPDEAITVNLLLGTMFMV